jgi:ribosome-associated protein
MGRTDTVFHAALEKLDLGLAPAKLAALCAPTSLELCAPLMPQKPRKAIPRPPREPATTSASRSHSLEKSRTIALLAAQAGLEKKATGVEIIDVTGKVDYADYLVLMTGASDRNVAAIAHEVDASLTSKGHACMSIEGLPAANWVLIDFVDVVVHVFQRDVRSLYDLDGLWMDADRIPVEESSPSA